MEISGQYLMYEEYRLLGGTLDLMPFNLLELEARKEIDKYTCGRLMNLDKQVTEVKACVYHLISSLQEYDIKGKNVSSETTDGYSVTYNSIENTIKGKSNEIKDIIKTYLINCKLEDGTPYLYIGVE